MDSFIGWIGGKKLLRNKIIEQFPDNFGRYIEVFGGAGWVLFAKEKHAALEVFNDKNGDLVNLFRCVKYHAPEMQRLLSTEINARELFDEYLFLHRNNPFQTDIQRAVQYFILIKTSYGCSIDSYGGNPKSLLRAADFLTKAQERLQQVVVEHKDFEDLICQYDREDALFYLDPPYYGTEKEYEVAFPKSDHERLQQCLCNLKGKFILSYNDHDYIRALYKDYHVLELERNHNLTARYRNSPRRYSELLIKNY